jgi:hypothetical protein
VRSSRQGLGSAPMVTTPLVFLVLFVLVQQWEHGRQERRRKQLEAEHREAYLRDPKAGWDRSSA